MDIPLSKHHSFRASSNFCNIVGFSAMRTRSSANSSVFTLQSLILIPSAAFFRRPIRSLIKMLNRIGESIYVLECHIYARIAFCGYVYY